MPIHWPHLPAVRTAGCAPLFCARAFSRWVVVIRAGYCCCLHSWDLYRLASSGSSHSVLPLWTFWGTVMVSVLLNSLYGLPDSCWRVYHPICFAAASHGLPHTCLPHRFYHHATALPRDAGEQAVLVTPPQIFTTRTTASHATARHLITVLRHPLQVSRPHHTLPHTTTPFVVLPRGDSVPRLPLRIATTFCLTPTTYTPATRTLHHYPLAHHCHTHYHHTAVSVFVRVPSIPTDVDWDGPRAWITHHTLHYAPSSFPATTTLLLLTLTVVFC